MKTIKNIGIFAHIDAGKTTLVERLLYETGEIRVPGKIEDGTTESDTLPEEIKRGISILSSVMEISPIFQGVSYKINIIDTPGHIDFHTQVEDVLDVVDLAVLLIDSVTGIKTQTELIYQKLKIHHIPFVVFLNKVDLHPNLEKLFSDIQCFFSEKTVKTFNSDISSIYLPNNLPEEIALPLFDWNDRLTEEYLNCPDKSYNLAHIGLVEGFWNRKITPVFAGSALNGDGVKDILQFICISKVKEKHFADNRIACVFKKKIDPELGKVAYIRVFEPLNLRNPIYLFQREIYWKEYYEPSGGELKKVESNGVDESPIESKIIPAGSVVVLNSIDGIIVGDYFKVEPYEVNFVEKEQKQFGVIVEPKSESFREKLVEGLDFIIWEDHGLEYSIDSSGQFELRGNGELHIEVALNRLKEFVGDIFIQGNLRVARYEVLKSIVKTKVILEHSVYGGKEKSGIISAYIEKAVDQKNTLIFHVNLTHSIKTSIDSGFFEVLSCGNFGHSVIGVSLQILSYQQPEGFNEHTISLLKVAVISGIRSFLKDNTIEIGPITFFDIYTPEEFLGQVLAGVQMRNAKIKEVETTEGVSYIKGESAAEKLIGFTGVLRNITKGKGTISMLTVFDSQNFSYI